MSERGQWDFFLAHAAADLRAAEALYDLLVPHSRVFLDSRCLLPGDDWDKEIVSAQAASLVTVVLVSPGTGGAYYQREEIANAVNMARRDGKAHRVVPVYLGDAVDVEGEVPFGLRLKHGLTLSGGAQYPEVARSLLALLQRLKAAEPGGAGDQTHPHIGLEVPGSVLKDDSAVYLERPCDLITARIRRTHGGTYLLKGPHQSGKTCLLTRTMRAAVGAGKQVVYLDFQQFDRKALSDSETFFRGLCAWVADALGLEVEDRGDEDWKPYLGHAQNCDRYLRRYVLKEITSPFVLAIDEVDVLFDTDFARDFFGLIRSWHNSRARRQGYENLDVLLAHTSNTGMFIDSLNESPFNSGESFETSDFTPQQVSELNRRFGSPLSAGQEQALFGMVGGHPYLAHLALYSVAVGRVSAAELLADPLRDDHIFMTHLRQLLLRLDGSRRLADALKEVLRGENCRDLKALFQLESAGLVLLKGEKFVPRCRLYADFFGTWLGG
jgi:hypothetical protein